jgi:Fe-S-cluster-containing dehydrogenase component
MGQKGWFIDLSKCIGCESCTVACKAEWNTAPLSSPLGFKQGALEAPKHVSYRWVVFLENGTYPKPERLFVTSTCNHCAEPACLKSCPVSDHEDWENPANAIVKRSADGVVLINQDRCIGCKYCIWACPYGAPQFNEATNKVEKCTFCVHRLEQGLEPACVTTCLGRALFMEDSFPLERSGENAPPRFADPRLTRPAVRFHPQS